MNNLIELKKTRTSFVSKNFQKRAVAPVIATLLLVAIAVVGGSIIFVFSQDFFATAQISGSPQIESVKILGYDATDGNSTQFHDGLTTANMDSGDIISDGLKQDEYIAVYLKNDSVNKITFSEVRLAGTVYVYVDLIGTALSSYQNDLNATSYTIVQQGEDASGDAITINSSAPELQPGQEATFVLALDRDVKIGRDMQFRLTTTNGAMIVSTIQSGQQNG